MSIQVGSRSFSNVDALEKLVVHAATEYEINGYVEDFDGVEVTDPEYDALIKELRNLNPNSIAFQGTSPSTATVQGDVVVHDPPMTSISKSDGTPEEKEAIYEKWKSDCETRLGKKTTFCQSYKRDGVAIRINYVNGKLVSAGLRPRDGINGTDVTRHAKYIEGVPVKLPLPLTLSLNGEIECKLEAFDRVNAEREVAGDSPYANPRNYTAGCLGRDDAKENKKAGLSIAFYSITGFVEWNDYYATEIERAKWANAKDGLNLQNKEGKGYYVRAIKHDKYSQLEKMEEHAKKLPYYTDGVVLKVDDLQDQEELGHTGDDPVKEPRYALAWKYAEETVVAEVSSIEWNASRTGRIVPTAIFDEPFVLANTSNTRATCNNLGWMEDMGLGPGAKVRCKKGGKIIPNIMEVLVKAPNIGAPTVCPSCGGPLHVHVSDSGNRDLQCNNPNCPAKQIKGWMHYLQIMQCKGLGLAAIEQIANSGKVSCIADLYKLQIDDLTPHGFSERQAVLALATIWKVKPMQDDQKLLAKIDKARAKKQSVAAWQFFASLGIPGAGKTAGKALVNHYKDFDAIRAANSAQLLEIDGIGDTTAEAIESFFKAKNGDVEALLQYFDLELPKTGKLSGQNFVLTGKFDGGKNAWQKRIEDVGGTIQGSVSSKTSYLVAGEETGKGKTDKANKLGIQIITVSDLEKML